MSEAKRLRCHARQHVQNFRVLLPGNNRVAVAVVKAAAVKVVHRVAVAASRRASVVAAVDHKAGVALGAAVLDQLHRKAVGPAQVHVNVIASGYLTNVRRHKAGVFYGLVWTAMQKHRA